MVEIHCYASAAKASSRSQNQVAHLSSMHSCMPQYHGLLHSMPLLAAKQMICIDCAILITLSNLKLLRIRRKRIHKIIPELQMVCIRMVRIEPRKIRQLATLVQQSCIRWCFISDTDVVSQVGVDKTCFKAEGLEGFGLARWNDDRKCVADWVSMVS